MLKLQLPLSDQRLDHRVRDHHECNRNRHHREYSSCCVDVGPEVKREWQGMLRKVQTELRLLKDISHHRLKCHACVRDRCRLAAGVNVDAYGVKPIIAIHLLEEEVSILSAVLIAVIKDVVVNLFHLVEEMA